MTVSGWFLPIRLYKAHYYVDTRPGADSHTALCGMTVNGIGSDLYEPGSVPRCKRCQQKLDTLEARGLI